MNGMNYETLIKHFNNNPVEAADKLMVTTATIYNWRKKGIPLSAQRRIEKMFRGKIKLC